jgi:hypothetical protein
LAFLDGVLTTAKELAQAAQFAPDSDIADLIFKLDDVIDAMFSASVF